jgi:hypothetical protein
VRITNEGLKIKNEGLRMFGELTLSKKKLKIPSWRGRGGLYMLPKL